MAPTDPKETVVKAPSAPGYLPEAQQQEWQATYAKAFKQAQIDTPSNDRAQRAAATKAANAILSVAAPTSAAEIDKLKAWQVIRRETVTIGKIPMRVCVTADGRKYRFPVDPKAKVPSAAEVAKAGAAA